MSTEENKALVQRLIAEHAAVRDDLGMMFQLGLVPRPPKP